MKTSLWFSWLIFVVAFAALCLAWFRCKPIEADWAAVLVTVIGSIAGIVIGWQVCVLIDMRKMRKDFERLRVEMAIEKGLQRRALFEFTAETRLLEAGRLIGSFDEKRGNYEVVGEAYCILIHALKNLVSTNSKFIDEVLATMRKCVYLAKAHNAWDKVFNDGIEQLSKNEYHFITSGLFGQSNYVSQIDDIKKWRQTKTMDEKAFRKTKKEFTKH